MGLFSNQFSNVVEWQENREDLMFWKWKNDEIKKGSRLIIRKGQDAIFMYNGKVEGIFKDEGSFDIESQIIPFLSTLKGIKFGFNSGVRCEVLFVNTKEFAVSWGTKNPISLPTPQMPGGMPIRAFGNFTCKFCDYDKFIDLARHGLPEGRIVNAMELSEEYPLCYARYVDATTTALQKHTVFGGIDPGVKVDIFFCVPTP